MVSFNRAQAHLVWRSAAFDRLVDGNALDHRPFQPRCSHLFLSQQNLLLWPNLKLDQLTFQAKTGDCNLRWLQEVWGDPRCSHLPSWQMEKGGWYCLGSSLCRCKWSGMLMGSPCLPDMVKWDWIIRSIPQPSLFHLDLISAILKFGAMTIIWQRFARAIRPPPGKNIMVVDKEIGLGGSGGRICQRFASFFGFGWYIEWEATQLDLWI